ncbi:MAG: triose-phosphate isomerase, partial [Firmicutes bacterium]|nr:triose-phosphate isomerase [Bacillota bacterium]
MNKLLVANWKMNMSMEQMEQFVKGFKCKDAVVCAPFTLIGGLTFCGKANFKIGAQNVSQFASGAYTGEISAMHLREVGVDYCLVGHSERRQNFGETNQMVF